MFHQSLKQQRHRILPLYSVWRFPDTVDAHSVSGVLIACTSTQANRSEGISCSMTERRMRGCARYKNSSKARDDGAKASRRRSHTET